MVPLALLTLNGSHDRHTGIRSNVMANAWYVVVPVGTNPPKARIAKVVVGSPADKAWGGNGSYQGWQVFMGPFPSEAAAKSAHPSSGLSAILDMTQAGLSAANVPGAGIVKAISNPIGAITDINNFLSRLTSVNTWIRVGEFVLGALLILAGALKLSGASSDLADVAKLATKVVK